MTHSSPKLCDSFGRQVTYLRLSVTDRCDLRCRYCMSENMVFLPKKDLLTIEELYRVASTFAELGIRKIRITGGEPLMRRSIMSLFAMLRPHIGKELNEVTLTSNGTLLEKYAAPLADQGVKRINVSLDTLQPERYTQITRRGDINDVLRGIEAARAAGLHVKINAVAMRGAFEGEVDDLILFAHSRGMDLTLIEEMPLGATGHNRYDTHLSLSQLRQELASRWTLTPIAKNSGGPARYLRVEETGGLLGLITPLSCDFCARCNRVRVGSTGRLYPCMGQTGMVELREILRSGEGNQALIEKIYQVVAGKPKGHEFLIAKDQTRGIARHMSARAVFVSLEAQRTALGFCFHRVFCPKTGSHLQDKRSRYLLSLTLLDLTPLEVNCPVTARRQSIIMRHNDHGCALFLRFLKKQIRNKMACVRIKIACWFIRNNDFGTRSQSARQCHTLLLSPRQAGRVMR